jgi:CheY-like chemotaxis protein
MQQIALVVDDSRVARMTLSKLLVAHDLEVIELGSGEEALVYLKSDNIKPDIIFMDVMMSGMDGLTATQHIKADHHLKQIPVVICTGHDTDADRAKSQEVGAMATISKPPEAEALHAIITELTQQMTLAAQADVSATSNPISTSSTTDSSALLDELKAMVKQDLLPAMLQELSELAETVSRQVAYETATHIVSEQVTSHNNQTDQQTLLTDVMAVVERDLLPKMQKDVREMVEDISRNIAADTAEKMVNQQVQLSIDALLPPLKSEVLVQAKHVTEDLANTVANHAVHDAVANSVEKAVQNAVKEAELSQQIMTMLDTEGKVWLQRNEQQMFEPLMQQIEAKLSPILMTYLTDNVTEMTAPIIRIAVEDSLANINTQSNSKKTDSFDHLALTALRRQINVLKISVIGLGVAVLVLTAAMFI